jgi:hypothetical protein
MIVEAVIHLKGVVQGLQIINEVGGPICDVDDELFIIESDTSIIDFKLDLMQADICELDSFYCDRVTLRDSLGDEVRRSY